MRLVALLLVVLPWYYTEEARLPTNVQSILAKTETTVAKNRTVYDSANEKAFGETEKSLKAELEKLTKAGKLDEAVQVKKLLETFRTAIVAKVDAAAMKEPQTLLPAGEDPLVGKWALAPDNAWEFRPDGTGTRFTGSSQMPITWVKTDAGYNVTFPAFSQTKPLVFQGKDSIQIQPGLFPRVK